VTGIIDFHVHSAPSLVPRHHTDAEIAEVMRQSGVATFVLKAHEGSTAERAALIGPGAVGGVVLNAAVGGANPDAVEVAARLGARVVWLPTVSAPAHRANLDAEELRLHEGFPASEVPLFDAAGEILPAWHEVFEVVAGHDLLLASGHLTMEETARFFAAATAHGVQRLLVNHPMLSFLGWDERHVPDLLTLGCYLEVGALADLLVRSTGNGTATSHLARVYPPSLLVFGSDLGHAHRPEVAQGIEEWLAASAAAIGERVTEAITTVNGQGLLAP
jgi:Family of unknown function (DUF6282)